MSTGGTGDCPSEEERSRGRGRPTKLTPEWIERNLAKLSEELASGTPQRFAGLNLPDPISEKTFYRWRNEGMKEEADDPHWLFMTETEKGLAKFERSLRTDAIKAAEAGDKQWACYITIAERRLPQLYGRHETFKHEGGEDFGKRSMIEAIAEYRRREQELALPAPDDVD